MSFKWETHRNSPNYTPNNRVFATWGRPRTIEAIAIHWWGDPNQNPSFDGVVDYLCRPGGGSSAHLVASGTGRRVSCLINFADASWATNSANPYTISIECDPRCRDEDYDVVAELIAQLRQVYGNLPLVPHKQFVATACPGNYDLDRLNRIAATKIARPEDDWGVVSTRQTGPTKRAVPKAEPIPGGRMTVEAILPKVELWDLETNPNYKSKKTFKKGEKIDVVARIPFNDIFYYQTEYSFNRNKWAINERDVKKVEPPKPVEPKPQPKPEPEPEKPVEQPEKPSEGPVDSETTTLLQDVKKLLEELTQLLKSIFKIGDK